MISASGIGQSWRKIWRSADIPRNIRHEVRSVQVSRALTHLPTIYAVAILNMLLVITLCWHEGMQLSSYAWMGAVLVLAVFRMIKWMRRAKSPVQIADPDRMLTTMTLVSVGGISALSAWTTVALFNDLLVNMTLLPVSLVFGASCIAHCLAPIKRAAICVLLVGVVPPAAVMLTKSDFELLLLGTSMLTVSFIMIRFIAASYNQIITGIMLEQKVRELAYQDPLTGLSNRRAIMEELQEAERNDGEGFAIAMMDMDGFKQVNDTLGHHIGDKLLKTVAERLRDVARENEHVARLGGDEFLIVIRGHFDARDIDARTTAFMMSLLKPANIDGRKIPMAGSMGYAIFPRDGKSASEIMKTADNRLYSAKRERKSLGERQDHSYQAISLPS